MCVCVCVCIPFSPAGGVRASRRARLPAHIYIERERASERERERLYIYPSFLQAVSELLSARSSLPPNFAVLPNEFEKDHDSNFHMAFISSFGNLRAR